MKKISLLLCAISMVSCGNSTPKTTPQNLDSLRLDSIKIEHQESVHKNKYYYNSLNQTARIIAGVNDPADTMFSKIRQSEAWKTYAKESDQVWTNYFTKNSALMNWAKDEVKPLSTGVKTLFYPFSGPDFLYANLFFPDAEMIYSLGLEKLGSVPQFTKEKAIDGYINAYKTSINEVLTDSYYRTIKMMAYLNNQSVDGVIPVIMLFMARAEMQIAEINYITLDANGVIIPSSKAEVGKQTNRGVEFKYYSALDDTKERRLVYFSGDVQESALAKNTAMKKYLDAIKTQAAFSKSASYLMHHPIFATVRNTILKGSDLVVSDDTGIAFRFYDPKIWNVQLYGSYNGCIDDFKYIFEKDLKAAYSDSSRLIKPLTFRIGYSRPSNMRIAVRKK